MTVDELRARLEGLHEDVAELKGLVRFARNALVAGFFGILTGLVMAGVYMERLDQTREDIVELKGRVQRLRDKVETNGNDSRMGK